MLQKCEKLLLYLFCSDLGSDFEEAESSSVSLGAFVTSDYKQKRNRINVTVGFCNLAYITM